MKSILEKWKEEALKEALRYTKGRVPEAARILELTGPGVRYQVQQYELDGFIEELKREEEEDFVRFRQSLVAKLAQKENMRVTGGDNE